MSRLSYLKGLDRNITKGVYGSLKQMSTNDQKNIKHFAKSINYTTSKIMTMRFEINKSSCEDSKRIVFYRCKSEDVHYKIPGKNLCILNFANHRNPGSTFPNDSHTQEEELLRKFPELFYSLNHSDFYPIEHAKCAVIVTDYVNCYRDVDYSILKKSASYKSMFVTAPAPEHREYFFEEYDILQYIRNIILAPIIFSNSSYIKNHRPQILVLGGWGCGSFMASDGYYGKYIKPNLSHRFSDCDNYIELIASMFKYILMGENMYKYYSKVVMAIPAKEVLDEFIKVFNK